MPVHGQIHGLVEQQEHAARALQLSTTVHALELAKLCTGNVHHSALRKGQGSDLPGAAGISGKTHTATYKTV